MLSWMFSQVKPLQKKEADVFFSTTNKNLITILQPNNNKTYDSNSEQITTQHYNLNVTSIVIYVKKSNPLI